MQRLYGWGIQLFKSKFRLWTGPLHANTQSVASGIVQRNVFMLLEKTHFAHAFGGDAACRDVGHGSAGEFQPRVGDVHFVRQHGDSNCLYFGHRFLDQRQQNVEVMNHQVIDHVHVQAARRENTQ